MENARTVEARHYEKIAYSDNYLQVLFSDIRVDYKKPTILPSRLQDRGTRFQSSTAHCVSGKPGGVKCSSTSLRTHYKCLRAIS